MKKRVWQAGVMGVGLALAGVAEAGTVYELGGDSEVSAYTGDEGLIIHTALYETLDDRSYSLEEGESSGWFEFFDIWTPESSVNWGEDTEPRPISASLDFDLPDTLVTVDGETAGEIKLFGLVQYGEVVWDGPVTVLAEGREFLVELSNTTFNEGFLSLWEEWCYGSTVKAKITHIGGSPTDPPGGGDGMSPIPTPSVAGAGMGMLAVLGLTRGRRRKNAA